MPPAPGAPGGQTAGTSCASSVPRGSAGSPAASTCRWGWRVRGTGAVSPLPEMPHPSLPRTQCHSSSWRDTGQDINVPRPSKKVLPSPPVAMSSTQIYGSPNSVPGTRHWGYRGEQDTVPARAELRVYWGRQTRKQTLHSVARCGGPKAAGGGAWWGQGAAEDAVGMPSWPETKKGLDPQPRHSEEDRRGHRKFFSKSNTTLTPLQSTNVY